MNTILKIRPSAVWCVLVRNAMKKALASHVRITLLDQTAANVKLGSTALSTSQLRLLVYPVKSAEPVYPSKYHLII